MTPALLHNQYKLRTARRVWSGHTRHKAGRVSGSHHGVALPAGGVQQTIATRNNCHHHDSNKHEQHRKRNDSTQQSPFLSSILPLEAEAEGTAGLIINKKKPDTGRRSRSLPGISRSDRTCSQSAPTNQSRVVLKKIHCPLRSRWDRSPPSRLAAVAVRQRIITVIVLEYLGTYSSTIILSQ